MVLHYLNGSESFAWSGSNTKNPILLGDDASLPALPWLYGDNVAPEGDYDKICWNTFRHGGFSDEYSTLSKFREALKLKQSLVSEFMAARAKYILEVNSGRLKLRIRGQAAKDLQSTMQEARSTALRLYRQSMVQMKTSFTVQTLVRYAEVHEGRTPAEDGVETVHQFFEGKVQEVVLTRDMARGEGIRAQLNPLILGFVFQNVFSVF